MRAERLIAAGMLAAISPAHAADRILEVPAQYQTVAAAAAAANNDRDLAHRYVIAIAPGTYTNDWPLVNRPMTLRAAQGPGTVTLTATAALTNANPGIITVHADLVVDGLALTGARNASNNGAGIRDRRGVETMPGTLTVRNSRFADDQNGILTDHGPVQVVVTGSLFMNSTRSHLLYANNFTPPSALIVLDSEFCGAGGGNGRHAIQSRNRSNFIARNRFWVGADAPIPGCVRGDGNYAIGINNGGPAIIADNQITKGPGGGNANTVAYAIDFTGTGHAHPTSTLILSRNCFFATRASATGVLNHTIAAPVIGDGNFFAPQFGTLVNPAHANHLTDTHRTAPAYCAAATAPPPPERPSPDGAELQPPTTNTLRTAEGVWRFSPHPDGGWGQYRALLNGEDVHDNRCGWYMRIAHHGQVFCWNSRWHQWWHWRDRRWHGPGPAP
jgi:hypothetical protein